MTSTAVEHKKFINIVATAVVMAVTLNGFDFAKPKVKQVILKRQEAPVIALYHPTEPAKPTF